ITARRPVLAEKNAACSRTTQAVTEQNHWFRRGVRGQINAHRNVPITRRVMNGQVHVRRVERRVHRQRIVIPCTCLHHRQRQQQQQHLHSNRPNSFHAILDERQSRNVTAFAQLTGVTRGFWPMRRRQSSSIFPRISQT